MDHDQLKSNLVAYLDVVIPFIFIATVQNDSTNGIQDISSGNQ